MKRFSHKTDGTGKSAFQTRSPNLYHQSNPPALGPFLLLGLHEALSENVGYYHSPPTQTILYLKFKVGSPEEVALGSPKHRV